MTSETVAQGLTTIGTIIYTYDKASRRATMDVPGQAQVVYGFDNANRLATITQGSAGVTIGYDNANRRASLTLPNDVVGTYTYDDASELVSIDYARSGTSVGDLSYSYDLAGRISSRGGSLFTSVLPAALGSASYNASSQLTNWGGLTPTYDLSGNLANDGLHDYTWDARNRLTSIQTGGLVDASFAYDGVNRRQSITQGGASVISLHDGYDPVQEQSPVGTVSANLLLGLAIDERFVRTTGSGVSNYLTDLLGSSVALTNIGGAVQTRYGYDPYGFTSRTGAVSDNSYQFTGRENNGLDLYYYRSRYYNPKWGRFVSEDPIGVVGGINLYAYVEQDPVANTDPLGLIGPGSATPPFAPPPPVQQCAAPKDCDDAYVACLQARGGMVAGSRVCGQARSNCQSGFPTIFAPGIVGRKR